MSENRAVQNCLVYDDLPMTILGVDPPAMPPVCGRKPQPGLKRKHPDCLSVIVPVMLGHLSLWAVGSLEGHAAFKLRRCGVIRQATSLCSQESGLVAFHYVWQKEDLIIPWLKPYFHPEDSPKRGSVEPSMS